MEGKGGEVKESRVKFAKNKLIFELIYFTLLPIPPPNPNRPLNNASSMVDENFLSFSILKLVR